MIKHENQNWYTPKEAANILDTSTQRVYQHLEGKKLGYCIDGFNKRLISQKHIDDFLAMSNPITSKAIVLNAKNKS